MNIVLDIAYISTVPAYNTTTYVFLILFMIPPALLLGASAIFMKFFENKLDAVLTYFGAAPFYDLLTGIRTNRKWLKDQAAE